MALSLEASLTNDFSVTHDEVIVIHDEANPEQKEKSQQILSVSLLLTRWVFQHGRQDTFDANVADNG